MEPSMIKDAEIKLAHTILQRSGLFDELEICAYPTFECIRPVWKGNIMDTVFSLKNAEEVIGKVQEKEKPFVLGQGCSLPRYSDVDAAHVVEISKDGKKVAVTLDKATLLNGFDSGEPDALVAHPGGFCAHVEGRQRYKLEAQPNGEKIWFTLRKNGRWVQVGQSMNGTSQQLSKAHCHHHDYNF